MPRASETGPRIGSWADSALETNASAAATARNRASYQPESAQELGYGMGLGSGYRTGLTSSATWSSSLRPVSFKGVVFPATQVRGSSGRKLAQFSYPYRPGQDVVDLGRKPLTLRIEAVFASDPFLVRAYGPDLYPGRFEKLLAAIHDGRSGELVHPVFGSLRAACESYDDTTQASELDAVRLSLTFVEDDTGSRLPLSDTGTQASAERRASKLDSFAAAQGVDLAAGAGGTFSEVVSRFSRASSLAAGTRDEVTASLATAEGDLRAMSALLPDLADPLNVSAKADLAALRASLEAMATARLAGAPPLVRLVTATRTTTLDIARERYLDPARAAEIERLNSIPDPLGIPPGTELMIHAY